VSERTIPTIEPVQQFDEVLPFPFLQKFDQPSNAVVYSFGREIRMLRVHLNCVPTPGVKKPGSKKCQVI